MRWRYSDTDTDADQQNFLDSWPPNLHRRTHFTTPTKQNIHCKAACESPQRSTDPSTYTVVDTAYGPMRLFSVCRFGRSPSLPNTRPIHAIYFVHSFCRRRFGSREFARKWGQVRSAPPFWRVALVQVRAARLFLITILRCLPFVAYNKSIIRRTIF